MLFNFLKKVTIKSILLLFLMIITIPLSVVYIFFQYFYSLVFYKKNKINKKFKTVMINCGISSNSLFITRLLAQSGYNIIVADIEENKICAARYSKYVVSFEIIPDCTDSIEIYNEKIVDYIRKYNIDYLINLQPNIDNSIIIGKVKETGLTECKIDKMDSNDKIISKLSKADLKIENFLIKNNRHFWFYDDFIKTCKRKQKICNFVNKLLYYTEADFDYNDIFPFVCKNHLQIPNQLINITNKGINWSSYDFKLGEFI